MLKTLRIKNFQKHKELVLDLDRVLIITGASDTGKSAVVRAFSFILLNNLIGSQFITEGEKECCVELDVDGHTIARVKGKGNTYALDGSVFETVKNSVPGALQEILRVSEYNIQNQHDSPLWVTLSAGQCMKEINKITDLDIIDRVLYKTNSDIRYTNRYINEESDKINDLQREHDKNKGIIPVYELLCQLEENEKRLDCYNSEVEDAVHKLDMYLELRNSIQQKYSVLDELNILLDRGYNRREELNLTNAELQNAIDDLHEFVELRNYVQKECLGLDELQTLLDEWYIKYTEINDEKTITNTLVGMEVAVTEQISHIKKLESIITENTIKLESVKVCPLCNQTVSP